MRINTLESWFRPYLLIIAWDLGIQTGQNKKKQGIIT